MDKTRTNGEIREIHHATHGRDLIERGYTVRTLVQWWKSYGQTARPYLWKERPEDTGYKADWSDPRKSPERFAAGQYAGMGRNTRYQKIEGMRL